MANFFSNLFQRSKPIELKAAELLQNSFSWFGGGIGRYNKSEVVVNAETANSVAAFYSCVRNISEDIAKLPIHVYYVDSNGNRTRATNHPALNLLGIKPNQFNTPFTLIETLIDRALRKGNGYAFIERDNNARPIALYFLENESVEPILSERKMFYRINNPKLRIEGTYTNDAILHLRGMGNGYIGVSVLDYASESIGKAIAAQQYAGKFFGSGANMTGLLKFIGMTDENKVAKAKQAFINSYKADGIGATTGSTEFIKMGYNADETQLIQTLAENTKDVARWFRMPLSKLQTSEIVNNIEALAIEYVNDCLQPWITRLEQEIKDKLFTEKEKPVMSIDFDTFMLLKGDTAAQERRVKTMFYIGASSANDSLRSLGMNTIGTDGDRRYVPVNMLPADLVDKFWQSKGAANIPTQSPDTTGSGATNANVNGE